jgi:succinate dehydrogenase/fumarate reductase flavoprotein subunit/uncharacterized protein with FMN-binding domain
MKHNQRLCSNTFLELAKQFTSNDNRWWRESMKRIVASILSVGMACSLTACSSSVSSAKMKDGTYSAEATGMDGKISINVKIASNKIESIDIADQNETAGVGDCALQTIADEVIESQSLGVDSVTGATVSSGAMKTAVGDAVKQAGGDASEWKNRTVASTAKDETFEYDVAVVGSGIAGLTAAMEAEETGAKVAVLEKQGIVGGTSIFSSGIFLAQDTEEGIPALEEDWMAKNKIQDKNKVDEDKVKSLVSVSPSVLAMYKDAGVSYELKKKGSAFSGTTFWPAASDAAKKNAETIKLASTGTMTKGGQNLINTLEKKLKDDGVEFYLNTPATSLIKGDDGSVKGVISDTEKNGKKTINAKSVILASGDYARNADMTSEYCADAAGNYTATAVTNTGDGISMALDAGAVMCSFQESMSGIFAPDPYDMPIVGQPYNSYPYECLLLNSKGERKVKEDAGTHDQMIYFVNENGQPDSGWVVMDQKTADKFLNLDKYLDATKNGSTMIQAFKENSLDALAKDMSIDASALQSSVTRYNELCTSGTDTDCGKDAKYLSAFDGSSYYAVKEYNMTRGNYGGIESNTNFEVTDKNGKAITGLYAAGIITSGHYFGDYYPGTEALALGAYSGYTAGKNASASAK